MTELIRRFPEQKIEVKMIATGPRGKSAYEIWLDAGNRGTEEDFLESLKVYEPATQTEDGLMSASDKTKVDNMNDVRIAIGDVEPADTVFWLDTTEEGGD